MKIGLAGYQGSGKSSLFHWLTGVSPDPSRSHLDQSAMAVIPEPRIEQLVEIYTPKKVTRAAIEVTDTPGLSRDHEGNAARLACLREADALVLVVAGYGGADPKLEYQSFYEDLLLADMELVSHRIERVEQSTRKSAPREEKEKIQYELDVLQRILSGLEEGKPQPASAFSEDEKRITRAFRLFTEKPRMVLVNTADDEQNPERFSGMLGPDVTVMAASVALQLELTQLSAEDAEELITEMGLRTMSSDAIIRTMMDISGQMIFFTAGEKEVRTWILRKYGTAVEAAGSIHSDLARGFIRAEIMTVADLVRLGSEREVKAAGLVRQEPKDYVIQDGDILLIRFSV